MSRQRNVDYTVATYGIFAVATLIAVAWTCGVAWVVAGSSSLLESVAFLVTLGVVPPLAYGIAVSIWYEELRTPRNERVASDRARRVAADAEEERQRNREVDRERVRAASVLAIEEGVMAAVENHRAIDEHTATALTRYAKEHGVAVPVSGTDPSKLSQMSPEEQLLAIQRWEKMKYGHVRTHSLDGVQVL